jgi:hypothetical protein
VTDRTPEPANPTDRTFLRAAQFSCKNKALSG